MQYGSKYVYSNIAPPENKINICYRQLIKEKIDGVFWNHIAMVKIPFNEKDKYMQKLTTKDGKKFVEVK